MVHPWVTGTSVIAIKYKDGVLIGADTLLSYGSMARFYDYNRLRKVSPHCIMSFTGDEADFIECFQEVNKLSRDARCYGTAQPTAKDIHNYISTRSYEARSDMKPVLDTFIVVGYTEKEGNLIGYTDYQGTSFMSDFVATGIAKHYSMPILRRRWNPELTKQEAQDILEECLREMWYNDTTASKNVTIGEVNKDGVYISEQITIPDNWDVAAYRDLRPNFLKFSN